MNAKEIIKNRINELEKTLHEDYLIRESDAWKIRNAINELKEILMTIEITEKEKMKITKEYWVDEANYIEIELDVGVRELVDFLKPRDFETRK